jgi:hypothetical protein
VGVLIKALEMVANVRSFANYVRCAGVAGGGMPQLLSHTRTGTVSKQESRSREGICSCSPHLSRSPSCSDNRPNVSNLPR